MTAAPLRGRPLAGLRLVSLSLVAFACNDGQAPPPTIAGEFTGTADVDHGFYGVLSQLPVNISVQQDVSFLSGTLQLGTTTFTLSGTADISTGQTTLRLTDAVAAGGSPSPCSGYELAGEGIFFQRVNNLGTAPLALRGEVTGTDCDGTMTVNFEADRR